MTPQQAIRILMLSPFYYKMDLTARVMLIHEFCAICSLLDEKTR